MQSVVVFDKNPTLFLQKVVERMKKGYYAEPSNEGYISTYPMFEIRLFQQEGSGVILKTKKFDEDEILITSHDSMKFILAVQEAVQAGYGIVADTTDWNIVGSSRVKMYKLPIVPDEVYTRDELENMGWTEIKELGYKYDVFNRGRKVMENALVKVFEGV